MIVFYLTVAQDALMTKISNKSGSINIKQSRANFFYFPECKISSACWFISDGFEDYQDDGSEVGYLCVLRRIR